MTTITDRRCNWSTASSANAVEITADTLTKLRRCSQGTIATQLFKRGFRQQFLVGLMPLNPAVQPFAGEAFTLRFIPSREDVDWDLADLRKRGEDNLQWEAVETIPSGHVLVVDSRNNPNAASAGDILLKRLLIRGAAAVITDGSFRDGAEISAMPLPAYCRQNVATTRPAFHRAIAMQEPIGCADVAVYPGDVVVGDRNGVTVIPRKLAAEIADESIEREQLEEFLAGKIEDGAPLFGTFPPNEETLAEYRRWKVQGSKI